MGPEQSRRRPSLGITDMVPRSCRLKAWGRQVREPVVGVNPQTVADKSRPDTDHAYGHSRMTLREKGLSTRNDALDNTPPRI